MNFSKICRVVGLAAVTLSLALTAAGVQAQLNIFATVPEWGALAQTNRELATSVIRPLVARLGMQDDAEGVKRGVSLGVSSLAEMESDLAAVDGLRSTAHIITGATALLDLRDPA